MTGWRTRARLAKTTGALQLISGWLTPCRQIIKYRFHLVCHPHPLRVHLQPTATFLSESPPRPLSQQHSGSARTSRQKMMAGAVAVAVGTATATAATT